MIRIRNIPPASGGRPLGRAVALLFVPLWLGACELPGWADPTDWFSGPAPRPERIAAEEAAAKGPYPSLSSVPQEPPRPSPQRQRDRLTEGLSADRKNARYSGEPLTGQGTGVAPGEASRATSPPLAGASPARQGRVTSMKPTPPGPPPALPPSVAPTPGRKQTSAWPLVAPPRAESAAVPIPRAGPDGQPGPEQAAARADGQARGQLIGVIFFLDGSSTLDAKDRGILRDIVLLQRQRGGLLRVVGHASRRLKSSDPVAQRLAKFELSLNRAKAVALAMVDLGAGRDQLEVLALSDSEPVYDESRPSGEAGNRRVEIFLEN